jgi:hypothetical protein
MGKTVSKAGKKTTWNGQQYDSQFEAEVAKALSHRVIYCGGSYQENPNFIAIKYVGSEGEPRWYVPDLRVVGSASTFIEVKGNLDRRSRQHLEAAVKAGNKVGVVLISEEAGKQSIWPKAQVTKAAWLEGRGIPFVYGADQAMKLLEVLTSVEVTA